MFGIGQLGLTPKKAIEALNSKVTEDENSFAAEIVVALNLPATGENNVHEVAKVGIYATKFYDIIDYEEGRIKAL